MANTHKPDKRELRLFSGLSIDFDPADADIIDTLKENPSEIAKCLVVKNGHMPVKRCQVVLDKLEYQFRNEWIWPPNGFEQKALSWAKINAPRDGKIDISANESATLEIVRLFRFPNPYFGIAYFDGNYGKTHHFLGNYKLRARIEGKIGTPSSLWEFEPIIYEVFLKYADTFSLEIEEIVRVSAL